MRNKRFYIEFDNRVEVERAAHIIERENETRHAGIVILFKVDGLNINFTTPLDCSLMYDWLQLHDFKFTAK